jgi:hypothetical protein
VETVLCLECSGLFQRVQPSVAEPVLPRVKALAPSLRRSWRVTTLS